MTKARDIASAAPAPSTVSATELGYLDGVTSAIQTQVDAKTAKSTLTTTGDIYYASSANTPARLGIGSTGNVLTVASGIPSWAAPAGGGKVLQVVTATTSTAKSIYSTTMTDTNITCDITPSSASSKILILITANTFLNVNGDRSQLSSGGRILRSGTEIYLASQAVAWNGSTQTGLQMANQACYTYLDSPATTSAITYKLQGNVASGTQGVHFNQQGTSTITLLEIGA